MTIYTYPYYHNGSAYSETSFRSIISAVNIVQDCMTALGYIPSIQKLDYILRLSSFGIFCTISSSEVDNAFEAIRSYYHLALEALHMDESRKFAAKQFGDMPLNLFKEQTIYSLLYSGQLTF